MINCLYCLKQTNSHFFNLPIKSHKINLTNISCVVLNIHKQNTKMSIFLFHFFIKLNDISWDNKFLERKQLKDTNIKPNALTKHFSQIAKESDFSQSKDLVLQKLFLKHIIF